MIKTYDFENVYKNCPLVHRTLVNMLYASETSFGAGIALTTLRTTTNVYVVGLYETKTGLLGDNVLPVGGKAFVKTTTPAPILDDCLNAFRAAGLAQHNTLRAKHGAKTMKQSSTIDASALAYAKELAAKNSDLVHSSTSYGENLFISSDSSNMDVAKCGRMKIFIFQKRIYSKYFIF